MEHGLGPRAVRMPQPVPADPTVTQPRRPRRGISVLPSLCTLANLFCGYACVVYAMRGEFATAAALSGRKVNLLGNIIVTQVGSLKWAFAAVAGVVLTILMGAVVAALLRVVDLRKEL